MFVMSCDDSDSFDCQSHQLSSQNSAPIYSAITISKPKIRFCLTKLKVIYEASQGSALHTYLFSLLHTLHSQHGFERKQQGTKYFPLGSPPFGACFLPVSGCQTVSVFSFLAFRGTHTHTHRYRPLWPHILFVMWAVIYCFPFHPSFPFYFIK